MYNSKRKKVRFINRWSKYIKRHTLSESKTYSVMDGFACMRALTLQLIIGMKKGYNKNNNLEEILNSDLCYNWEVITK